MPATPTTRTTIPSAARAATNGGPNTPATTTAPPAGSRSVLTTRQRVLTALAGRPDGVTVAELAAITGLGHSTVGKALTAAETDGLAIRTPGGRTGNRRAPDTWTPPTTTTPPAATESSTAPTTAEPTTAPAEAAAEESVTHAAAPDADEATPTTENGHSPAAGPADTAPAQTAPAPSPAAGGKSTRLGKGQLADLTLAWLRQNPGAHTASAIGKSTGRSSGAIANALAKMATTGTVTQVSDHPRRYTATTPA